ncbi:MAG: hypothetical protein HKN15_08125, partial [Xanthomonadales bacterium]|nr:hypothetical protein [Xanthomonadales bacterium]
MSFFEELKRRNVIRVAIAYLITAWLVAQVLQLLFESFGTPEWVMKTIIVLMAFGLVFAVIFAWAYELTPDGIKRESEIDSTATSSPVTARRLDRAIIIVLVLAVGYFAWESRFSRQDPAMVEATSDSGNVEYQLPAQLDLDPSIAVLPFADMSPDKDQEYFSDGIAEELLNLLVRVDGLTVASRTSSFSYKNTPLNIAEIAEELQVNHILEGSVRKADNRVRITAQLIDAATDRHLWSDTYDRELEDIFGIQGDIANAIVLALRSELGIETGEQAVKVDAATENLDAYQLFLEARGLFIARAELPRAVGLFERAVELDPGYARAWAGLAATYSVMRSWGHYERDYIDLSRAAAERAMELDPELSTAWAAIGQYAVNEGDMLSGLDHLDKAIELDPNDATSVLWRAIATSMLGFHQESIAYYRRCLELDPAYENCRRHLALTYFILGDNEQGLSLFRQGLELGFRSAEHQLLPRFITLGEDLLAAKVVWRDDRFGSTFPGKEILDAIRHPERDHSRGLRKFLAHLEQVGIAPSEWSMYLV